MNAIQRRVKELNGTSSMAYQPLGIADWASRPLFAAEARHKGAILEALIRSGKTRESRIRCYSILTEIFRQFQHYRPDTEFWDLTNSHNSLFTYSVVPPVHDGPPDIEGMELEKEPPVDTTLYDTVDEATEEDLTAPESLRPVYVEICTHLRVNRLTRQQVGAMVRVRL